MLGEHPGGLQCRRVDGHHGEVFGDVACMHNCTIRPGRWTYVSNQAGTVLIRWQDENGPTHVDHRIPI
jgi:hypothetical protein